MKNISKELVEQELQKLGIQPNPVKEPTITDVAALPKQTEVEKAEVAEVEKKIKELQKTSTFSLKISGEQKQFLTRLGQSLNLDWKEALKKEIEDKIFAQSLGDPKISFPSWASPITGPSNPDWRQPR
jgi:uncharacterized protein YydD (DUF2326 family)